MEDVTVKVRRGREGRGGGGGVGRRAGGGRKGVSWEGGGGGWGEAGGGERGRIRRRLATGANTPSLGREGTTPQCGMVLSLQLTDLPLGMTTREEEKERGGMRDESLRDSGGAEKTKRDLERVNLA